MGSHRLWGRSGLPFAVFALTAIASPSAFAIAAISFPPSDSGPLPARFDSQGHALGEPLSDRVVAYEIETRLDPKTETLTGKEALTWTNKSSAPQSKLWFHLYLNAFKNERSTFYRDAKRMGGVRDESSDGSEYPNRKKDEWGYSDMRAIGVRGGADLLPSLRFEQPDDDNRDDQTVFTVTLAEPVGPGDSVTLDIEWVAHVPRLVARTGHLGDFYMLGQWFPKIGVLEIPPSRGAEEPRWNCHQFHSNTEFYADFGTYDVKMTVPKEMRVGASGLRVETHDNDDGTTTYRHRQDDVHDFAWTAWSGYEVVEDTFSEPGLHEVGLTVMLHPEHQASREQILSAVKASLRHYGHWWYPFPYPHLTVVDTPNRAPQAAGMEYPTLITISSSRTPNEPKDYSLWNVTAHEFGHNYWYGIIASNEFEESWLDEGINSYGTAKLALAEGITLNPSNLIAGSVRPLVSGFFRDLYNDWDIMHALGQKSWDSPIITDGWKYRNGFDYTFSSYFRPQLNLFMLEKLVGSEAMAMIMRTYVDRWKFKHPRSEDFFSIVNEVTGQDYGWYLNQAFRSTKGFDPGVSSVRCDKHLAKFDVGVFDGEGGSHDSRDRQSVRAEREQAERADLDVTYDCEVNLERKADGVAPVQVRVTFEDGSVVTDAWDGQEPWKKLQFTRSGKGGQIRHVEVDPTRTVVSDASPANNSYTLDSDWRVTARIFGWVTYVTEMVMSALSFIV
jgi:hypothetical protein